MRRTALIIVLLALGPACRPARTTPPAAAPAPAAATPSPPPPALQTGPAADPEAIRWVRDAAEYRAAVWQVYRYATRHVENEARTRSAGTWAVVLDADETVISNVTYQQERARQRRPFTPASWDEWVRRRAATPLPGAPAFLSRVSALGGRIAIVTNRLESQCADTRAVFERHALVFDVMLCRPDGAPSDKNPRFDAVAQGQTPAGLPPLEIVAFVGDNIHDFPRLSQAITAQGDAAFADFGVRYFVVPNPMYGSWQQTP